MCHEISINIIFTSYCSSQLQHYKEWSVKTLLNNSHFRGSHQLPLTWTHSCSGLKTGRKLQGFWACNFTLQQATQVQIPAVGTGGRHGGCCTWREPWGCRAGAWTGGETLTAAGSSLATEQPKRRWQPADAEWVRRGERERGRGRGTGQGQHGNLHE